MRQGAGPAVPVNAAFPPIAALFPFPTPNPLAVRVVVVVMVAVLWSTWNIATSDLAWS